MTATPSPGPRQAPAGDSAFVTLTVADQACGIAVLGVRDILGEQAITPIPLAGREIAGSLNLRGRIVTAIDLRRRLGLDDAPQDAARMSVVIDQGGELYALLVDQVSEVLSLPADRFEPNPSTMPPPWSAVSLGVFRLEERLLVVLNTAQLLSMDTGSWGRA
jgi:purine-binding chemotaxis protein CheW